MDLLHQITSCTYIHESIQFFKTAVRDGVMKIEKGKIIQILN